MDTHKMDLPHYNHSSLRFMYLVNKYAVFKGKTFMLWLLSRCSISEFLGAQDHKNEAAEQCEEAAGSWSAALLQPARLHWDCSVLCLWGRQQPLTLMVQLSLLNFLLAPLPSALPLSGPGSDVTHFTQGRHTECSSRGSHGT